MPEPVKKGCVVRAAGNNELIRWAAAITDASFAINVGHLLFENIVRTPQAGAKPGKAGEP
jgi:hypothetical protein